MKPLNGIELNMIVLKKVKRRKKESIFQNQKKRGL